MDTSCLLVQNQERLAYDDLREMYALAINPKGSVRSMHELSTSLHGRLAHNDWLDDASKATLYRAEEEICSLASITWNAQLPGSSGYFKYLASCLKGIEKKYGFLEEIVQ